MGFMFHSLLHKNYFIEGLALDGIVLRIGFIFESVCGIYGGVHYEACE